MALEIEQFMCRTDNFGVLARNPATGEAFLVDAPEEQPIVAAVERTGWRPKVLLVTHHHRDHTEANLALKERYGLTIIGPAAEAAKIPGFDRQVAEGDTLFAIGCGRVIEGKPAQMHASLAKLARLPAETQIYCGHEYTLANARFALTVDPTNSALKQRAREVETLRAADRPTLPTTLALELSTNPFLRWHDPAIRRNLGMETASDAEVFAEIRKRKDVA